MSLIRWREQASPGGKILVVVVAYEAERHVVDTFERIPEAVLRDPEVDFVCLDDASTDAGADRLAKWAAERQLDNLTVLRNPVNQGYGGNQKLGYRLAIDGGYEFVILLHGDGQYAPELLDRFIEAWRRDRPDVVLGSRIAEPGGARRGGMPLYKLAGNRVLTWMQNALTGLGLSEYHTGYRGYSTSFLARVPFELDTNDFHFDTEILLQAAHLGARIVEFPIPTRYADEVSHVAGLSGFRYGANVMRATLGYRLHQLGMFTSLRYRDLGLERYRDKTQMLYSSHRLALEEVAAIAPRRVLDIGSGPGSVARECRAMGAEVVGIDLVEPPPGTVSEFFRADLDNDPLPVDPFDFDCVLMLDVIEHLSEPERFMLGMRNASRHPAYEERPTFVISTPNVAFAAIRANLLFGRFAYADRGIMDVTHRRLFTRASLASALRDCGYEVKSMKPVPVPFENIVTGSPRLGRLLTRFASLLCRVWPTMFAFQFLAVCEPLPGVSQVLGASEQRYVGARAPRPEDSADADGTEPVAPASQPPGQAD
jgi:glycosyltransferase involved in cell wall biosynthesis/2-polyprenyl-3-methyl-5-hydroxy-6-metoxy-1,4-benzoquinol methylase